MIYDTLANIHVYDGLHPRMKRALALLATTDFASLADGKYEVEGNDLFYMLSTYDSKPQNDTPEAHKKYIDIQFLISGQELVGVAPVSAMRGEAEAHPESDIWFYHGPTHNVLLAQDRFLVLYPHDAHAPCIAVDKPQSCRKCVIKVKAE